MLGNVLEISFIEKKGYICVLIQVNKQKKTNKVLL